MSPYFPFKPSVDQGLLTKFYSNGMLTLETADIHFSLSLMEL